MDAYQSKPLDRETLARCLSRLLDDDEIQESSPAQVPLRPADSAPSSATESATPVDWRKIEQAADGDSSFTTELVNAFVGSSREALRQIEGALAVNDLEGVQRAAHSLKGASASIGALTTRTLAANLETAAKGRYASEVALLYEALRNEVMRANEFLQEKMAAA